MLSAALLAGCSNIKRDFTRSPSASLPAQQSDRINESLGADLAPRLGQTGVYLLPSNLDAFAARSLSADVADRTIDLQYYIVRKDLSSQLLFERLLSAADRGVRVRVLLDDVYTEALDRFMLTFDSHENIEVRLFNPFLTRGGALVRGAQILTRGVQLNRRMHNKSWIVDNTLAIIGGRNLGDEYFDADTELSFADLDLAAVGLIVNDISRSFDQYWNSELAYPISSFKSLKQIRGGMPKMRNDFALGVRTAEESAYLKWVRDRALLSTYQGDHWPWLWTTQATFLADDPSKIAGQKVANARPAVSEGFKTLLAKGQREAWFISPYFVPGDAGMRELLALRERGLQVSVLTNSLAATDVPAVHSGYMRYREPLLAHGVKLFELKARPLAPRGSGFATSSPLSLHAKAFVLDDRWVFVGSFNLDPRSAYLNSENGLLIESTELALQVSDFFRRAAELERSYQLKLDSKGKLEWHTDVDGVPVTFYKEPNTTKKRRWAVAMLRLLPLEPLL